MAVKSYFMAYFKTIHKTHLTGEKNFKNGKYKNVF